MSRFKAIDTPMSGLKVFELTRIADERGFLSRLFCADELRPLGWAGPIAQINHTMTRQQGAVRGMHFQHAPHGEMKLVSCLRGEVWDVAVDLRCGSPTFLQWFAEKLSCENGHALLIPEGFAHGFQTLTPDCELIYLHDAFYAPDSESGVHPLDPRVGIDWPLAVGEMSERDRKRSLLDETFRGIPV